MKRYSLGLAGIVLSGGLALYVYRATDSGGTSLSGTDGLILAAAAILTVLGAAILWNARSPAGSPSDLFRLDIFLPFLRKRKKNASPRSMSRIGRMLRFVLPASWFSDPVTGRPGRLRRFLKRVGPSALSSPVRRVIQSICFGVFLGLFFYVLWPYTARPAPPGETSSGWQFREIENERGRLRFVGPAAPDWLMNAQAPVFIYPMADSVSADGLVIEGLVTEHGLRLEIEPVAELSPRVLDRLLTGSGDWEIAQDAPDHWPSHYTDDLAAKEWMPADAFLVLDPLVSLSTAVAARSWVWSLVSAFGILVVCILIPRGFCGYLCPLGTLIDLFDWAIGRRITRFRVSDEGWWVHLKYYVLLGVMLCSVGGVLVSGYVAAIPVITRGLLFLGEPLQTGVLRGQHLIVPFNAGHYVSLVLFVAVLGLGLLKPRFWCKYVCPSGAVFSLGNLFRVAERKVESTCINCNKCVEICPFDAIKPDFTTRVTDCTLCQTCGGVCPTHAIKFVERWNLVELKVAGDPPTGETALGRRGFLSLAAGTAAAFVASTTVVGATRRFGGAAFQPEVPPPVRPPGSVPEPEFLQLCIRCGECFKACPNNVLQAQGFSHGWEGLWTPLVNADWAGCESSCNACGQVCPTGAIRALSLAEKKVARMGLAIVNTRTCLPWAGREACQLCVDECHAAGYHAIEFTGVHTEVDEHGMPVEGSGFVAPVVLPEKCVGCGLCQTRCYGINVADKGLLDLSAIIIEAGPGNEDRLSTGSYLQLRQQEAKERGENPQPQKSSGVNQEVVPAKLPVPDTDPFGVGEP